MKLTWSSPAGTTPPGTPFLLADDDLPRGIGQRVVQSLQPSFRRNTQTRSYTRATAVEVSDRKNLQTTVRASVHYQFANGNLCAKFLAALGQAVNGAGVLRIDYGEFGAVTLAAVWDDISTIQNFGASAVVTYTFTGGAFETPSTPA